MNRKTRSNRSKRILLDFHKKQMYSLVVCGSIPVHEKKNRSFQFSKEYKEVFFLVFVAIETLHNIHESRQERHTCTLSKKVKKRAASAAVDALMDEVDNNSTTAKTTKNSGGAFLCSLLIWHFAGSLCENRRGKNRVPFHSEFRVFCANKWSTCLFAKCSAKQEPGMWLWWWFITDGECKKFCVAHTKPFLAIERNWLTHKSGTKKCK